MNPEQQLISDITVFSKYARYWHELGRRETYEEIVARNRQMHITHLKRKGKLTKEIQEQIDWAYKFVADRKVFPSMRSMQFGGEAILQNNSRMFNCSYMTADDPAFFRELMFLLMSGTGVGYSVQRHHVKQLPVITMVDAEEVTHVIQDSIEGWADAIDALIASYMEVKNYNVTFDYSLIRPQGAILKTSGGKAPGPEPLRRTLEDMRAILDGAVGRKLTTLEVHDIACIIARAVLSGGIRRSAMISLFSPDDPAMLTAKSGEWWNVRSERAFANNSAVLLRGRDDELFHEVFQRAQESGSGEPGIFWVDDMRYGTNPCKPLDSVVLTSSGYRTFRELLNSDEDIEVILPDGNRATASKPFRTGENATVMRVTLSNGTYLYGTGNHLHQTPEGEWVRLDELEIGDKLAFRVNAIYEPDQTTGRFEADNIHLYEHGILAGWVHGDGWIRKNSFGVSIGVHEFDYLPEIERIIGKSSVPHNQKPDTCRVIDNVPITHPYFIADKDDLTWLYGESKDLKLGFIRGIFTTDGSVRKSNNVELYSTRRHALEVVSNILREFGIYSTITVHSNEKSYYGKDGKRRNNELCWKLNVYAGQFKRIGFLTKFKNDLLANQVEKGIYRYVDYVTVTDIEPEYSVEDVYDITVYDDSHAFIDTGVVTHNCAEITLNNMQYCNLTTINVGTITNQHDFNERATAAAIIGTLQATYTDFHYLRPEWKRMTDKEALLGVSMTGIASGNIDELDASEAASHAVAANDYMARLLGINAAARVTAVKPEGTASLVAGTSSGIHAWHDKFFIRRMRFNKVEAIAQYLMANLPYRVESDDANPEIVEDDVFNPHQIVVAIPQRAPEGALTRDEGALDLLNRVSRYHEEWIRPGNNYGGMTNNISATINIQDHEWSNVRRWMWNNRFEYNGLSLLPYSDHTYRQAPYQSITEDMFNDLTARIAACKVDLRDVREWTDETSLAEQAACAGGACELPW